MEGRAILYFFHSRSSLPRFFGTRFRTTSKIENPPLDSPISQPGTAPLSLRKKCFPFKLQQNEKEYTNENLKWDKLALYLRYVHAFLAPKVLSDAVRMTVSLHITTQAPCLPMHCSIFLVERSSFYVSRWSFRRLKNQRRNLASRLESLSAVAARTQKRPAMNALYLKERKIPIVRSWSICTKSVYVKRVLMSNKRNHSIELFQI